MTSKTSRDYQYRVFGSALAVFINFLILLFQIPLFGEWEQDLSDPLVLLFLVVISIFCLAESWVGSARCEVFEFRNSLDIDMVLAALTGVILLVVFSFSLGEHIIVNAKSIFIEGVPGATLVLFGIYFRVLAYRDLKSAFTSLPRVGIGETLVERGVYRFVRHPSEVGLFCISYGVGWMMDSLIGALITVLFVLPISYIRVLREEKHLACVFKEKYGNYKKRIPAAFPIFRIYEAEQNDTTA